MNSLMEYKGYHAKIEFSADDMIFVGRVLGINDTIAFDGDTIPELEAAFRESIDDYLETCAEIGKAPDKEYKGTFNVRISPELHKRAVIEAEAQNLSLNQLIQRSIEHEISGYHTRETVTIVMPAQIFEKYMPPTEADPFDAYDFDREEELESCRKIVKFQDFAS